MDGSPRPETRPPTDSTSPTLSTSTTLALGPSSALHQPTSNASLAALLSEAYRESETLRRELAQARKRAEKSERIFQILHIADVPTSPPPGSAGSGAASGGAGTGAGGGGVNGDQTPTKHAQQLKAVIDEYEERLARAEAARDEAELRRREVLEGWDKLEQYLSQLDISARDARLTFRSYVAQPDASLGSDGHRAPLRFPSPATSPYLALPHPPGSSGGGGIMGPPPSSGGLRPTRHHHAGSGSSSSARGGGQTQTVAFPLPPHPNPTPTSAHPPQSSVGTGARRPRTPSIDSLHGAAQPPSKRARGAVGDDYRAREPRAAYSESYIQSGPVPTDRYQQAQLQHQHYPLQPGPPSSQSQATQGQQTQPRPGIAEPRIIDRKYRSSSLISSAHPQHAHVGHGHTGHGGHGHGHHTGRPGSPGHSRSGSQSSSSSMDLDEMLLKTATGEELAHAGANGNGNGNGNGRLLPADHPGIQYSNSRRRLERDADGSLTINTSSSANPYPPNAQSQPGSAYPNTAQSASGSMRNVTGAQGAQGQPVQGQGSQAQVYTTHVFAPVVTGAPTKKSKYPNTAVGAGGSGDAANAPSSNPLQPLVPYAATNAQGQRICRQCGIVGRYKDGKCVEKWGPGPMGPGTVCDRCRKKMKRVERRGTLENQQQQQLAALQAQQRAASHSQLPLSETSDRNLHRSDTILTQTGSFVSSSNSTRDRNDLSSSSHVRSSHTSSSMHSAASPGKAHRQQPSPPHIAALRDDDEDEEDDRGRGDRDRDPEQLPTSNIGRGGSAVRVHGAGARSDSRNGRARSGARPTPPGGDSHSLAGVNGGSNTKRSPLGGNGARASISPRQADGDEMDADADADAEAEAEAEILGAVDAAGEADDVDGDGEGELDNDGDADAEAELLEAVDAAEANSSSSHGGERSWTKAEPS